MGYEVYYRKTKDGDRYDVFSTVISKYLKRGLQSPEQVAGFIILYDGSVSSDWELALMRKTWELEAQKQKALDRLASAQADLNIIKQKQDEVRNKWREESKKRKN